MDGMCAWFSPCRGARAGPGVGFLAMPMPQMACVAGKSTVHAPNARSASFNRFDLSAVFNAHHSAHQDVVKPIKIPSNSLMI